MSRLRRSPTVVALATAAVLLLPACEFDTTPDPARDAATVSETLPEDAFDLENPEEVVSPGGGSGETEEDAAEE
ncbi:MAG: hypothetical protein KY457_06910 [Actinobacteria bacterium]|nr:hypothetical protein [Actinomycetota bacterium]